jgi:hypothetical protein
VVAFYFVGDGFEAVFAPGEQRDVPAGGGHAADRRRADARTRTGYENGRS